MAIQAQPVEAPTASPAPIEQSLSTFLHGEVMNDLDDGRPTLIAATEANLGDLRETSPARLRGMIADARAQLDQIERLANEYEAIDTLRAILAEHGAVMEEWDTATLDPKLRRAFAAFAMLHKDGSRLIVVPQGQDPIERVKAVAELVNDLQAQTAVQA